MFTADYQASCVWTFMSWTCLKLCRFQAVGQSVAAFVHVDILLAEAAFAVKRQVVWYDFVSFSYVLFHYRMSEVEITMCQTQCKSFQGTSSVEGCSTMYFELVNMLTDTDKCE